MTWWRVEHRDNEGGHTFTDVLARDKRDALALIYGPGAYLFTYAEIEQKVTAL